MAKSNKTKPTKPYKDFPLFPHASGQWAKKIRGRLVYFGVWAEPDLALQKYLSERDYLQAGLVPPPETGGTTLLELCNSFAHAKKERVRSGELEHSTWRDYFQTCNLLLSVLGRSRRVNLITPADFTQLREVITQRFSPSRAAREITQVRMVFRWGHDQELSPAPRFGSEFRKPSKKVLRRRRQQRRPNLFAASEIREMLGAASMHTRAWILLGINGGLIQKDLSDLTLSAVDLDKGWIDFPRHKTAIERRIPLWQETVSALRGSLGKRWTPKLIGDGQQFFLTREGNRLVRHHDTGTKSDAVHNAMERLQTKFGIKQRGRSFGAFRHTFRTVADEVFDTPAILRIMGHSDPTISDHYRERISDDRLVAVSNHVLDWLFASRDDAAQTSPGASD